MEKRQSFNPDGRPTKYKPEYDQQAYKLCLLGAKDKQLADFFEVNEDTIHEWKKVHKSFSESLRNGKENADSEIAASLYHRAKGYTHDEEKIFQHDGQVIRAKTKKHYPPDPTSMIYWLKNRQKVYWRDRHEVEHSGTSVHVHFDKDDEGLVKQKKIEKSNGDEGLVKRNGK